VRDRLRAGTGREAPGRSGCESKRPVSPKVIAVINNNKYVLWYSFKPRCRFAHPPAPIEACWGGNGITGKILLGPL
jgi:hypothetical protein